MAEKRKEVAYLRHRYGSLTGVFMGVSRDDSCAVQPLVEDVLLRPF